jgi:hypothetical protein
VTVSYVSKYWKTAADGASPGTEWTVDTDLSLLPGDVLQMGAIWRFKRHKRLYYADFKAEYEGLIARAMSSDRPRGKVGFDGDNRRRMPQDIPVPDYIPPL